MYILWCQHLFCSDRSYRFYNMYIVWRFQYQYRRIISMHMQCRVLHNDRIHYFCCMYILCCRV